MTRSFRGIRLIRFGDFALDVRAAELHKNGGRVRLQEQPFRILVMLLERPGEVVLRDELRKRLWPNGTIVEVGHGINAAVLRLREALGDSAENPRYIETLARRGYRFIGQLDVEYKERSGPPAASSEPIAKPSVQPPLVSSLDTSDLGGHTIAHYQVLEKLGGGGMGVVYRASDLRLGRQVALKFLSHDMSGDPVALGRFQREARAASALNHPNICTVYGVEEHSGVPLIVMEYLEGDTLEARLSQGPLPVPKALALAVQMADALDAAHRKGIVHRDLKPGNVLLTKSGVKVLDFGLAKMERAVSLGDEAGGHVTQQGAILGTLHYMSPEQVQGKDADACSDIFSFGLVLYEMLAGRRAFPGENSATVMAAILTWQPPDLREPIAPAGLDRVLHRCLAKDPEDRWQSARDLKAALEWVAAGWNPGMPAAPPPPTPAMPASIAERVTAAPSKSGYWIAGTVLVVILLSSVFSWYSQHSEDPAAWHKSTAQPPAPRWTELTKQKFTPVSATRSPAVVAASSRFTLWGPDRSGISRLSLSPDGRRVAFMAGGKIYVRSIDSPESRPIDGITNAGSPFWSPDGRFLAVMANSQLKIINVENGSASDLGHVNTNLGGTWGPDGSILIGQIGDGIFSFPAAGGVSSRVTNLDFSKQETRHFSPQFLPDGRHFLFVSGSNMMGSTVYAGSLDGGPLTSLGRASSNVQYVPSKQPGVPGYLLYVRDGLLMASPFDPVKLRTLGEPVMAGGPITTAAVVGSEVGVAEFSATPDVLAFRSSGVPDAMAMKGLILKIGSHELSTRPAAVNNITVIRNWMTDLKR